MSIEIIRLYEVVKEIGYGNFAVAKLVRYIFIKEIFVVKFIERGRNVFIFFTLSFYVLCVYVCLVHYRDLCYETTLRVMRDFSTVMRSRELDRT